MAVMTDDANDVQLAPNPTPEQRADYVLYRLEQFIREGRTVGEGLSFRKWKIMARAEIANNIAEVELGKKTEDRTEKRLLFTFGASLITIGFWGTAVSLTKVGYLAGALVIGFSGLALIGVASEWQIRKWFTRKRAKERHRTLRRVEDLNRRIKKLERELEKEEKGLKKALKKSQNKGVDALFPDWLD